MIMHDEDILREYMEAANPRKQIPILADQNCVTTPVMAQWLIDHGAKVDKRVMNTVVKKKPEAVADVPDQTIKADAGKPRLSLVPPQIILDIAAVREYGNKKYPEGGKDNWKQVDPERYRDALFRHLLKYIEDPDGVDDESGLTHLAHLACNVAFLCELEAKK